MIRVSTTLYVMIGLVFSFQTIHAQNSSNSPFSFYQKKDFLKENEKQQVFPKKYASCIVDIGQLKSIIEKAPKRFSSSENEIVLSLPLPDGSFSDFSIKEWSMMHPELATKYPQIQSFVGNSLDDPTTQARLDLTPHGFHGMIRSGNHNTIFIDPLYKENLNHYAVYYKKDYSVELKEPLSCLFNEVNKNVDKLELVDDYISEQGDCQLRTYRLALACTGEYANFHGGSVSQVLGAMNTTMNRVNGIFENEFSVFMQLVPNNDQLIFLNSNSDPYTNSNGSAMLSENQTTCDNVIGSANYDIGHVFSTGGGGVAYLGCVCNSVIKAGGVTGQSSPTGDPFDVDYVSHEMGHQFGATHTQNNNCNRSSASSMEPGSASTIMGYAGICTPNVQNNSDDYFHAISIQQIGTFVTGSGNACSSITPTNNNQPSANAGLDYVIPKLTPFILTGTASDIDGTTSLTYSWEQMDAAAGSMPPQSSNTAGPMFRSLKPSANNYRYFPNLEDLVNNVSPTWEVLSSVDRTMNFRFTVRDNHVDGGCTDEDDMVLSVDSNSGPFEVSSPNTSITWTALSNQTVSWNVNGTDLAPVNASKVDILLSIDGGMTYPFSLAKGVANDGSHIVNIPNHQTATARIMVKGSEHVFFDISNQNFTISAPSTDFILNVLESSQSVCVPEKAIYILGIEATGGYSGNVAFDLTGLPVGVLHSFLPAAISAPGASELLIENTDQLSSGSYPFTISASGSTGTKTLELTLIVASGTPDKITLSYPTNGESGVSNPPTLSWETLQGVNFYEIQLASDPDFTNILSSIDGINNTSYTLSTALAVNTIYHWRVRGTNNCGNGEFSEGYSFRTANLVCESFESTEPPKVISAAGAPTVTSTISVTESGTISDVNIINLDISHTWVNDLIVSVISPDGTQVLLFNQLCSSHDNIHLNFDDDASKAYEDIPCPPTNNGNFQPLEALSKFTGKDIEGTWIISVQDLFNQDGGTLNGWDLELCYQTANEPLTVTTSGTNVSCKNGNNGTVTAIPGGGTPPYSILWNVGNNTEQLFDLEAGSYSVIVTDSDGNTASSSISISEPSGMIVNTFVSAANCHGNTGSATAIVSGGVSPYTYQWSNSIEQPFNNQLAEGTYLLTVTDQNGCSQTASAVVPGATSISASVSGQDIDCFGGNNGFATATGSGGNNYVYNWSNGLQTQTINNLTAGTYAVTITETTSGCSTTTSIDLTEPSQIILTMDLENTACGLNNGTMSISASGGVPPYAYQWSNGETGNSIVGLVPGSYSIIVTDNEGCSQSSTGIISQSSGLNLNITAFHTTCGLNNGFISIEANGGEVPYSYSWSNGQTNPEIDGLESGVYTVVVSDKSGCSSIENININTSTGISLNTNYINTTCGLNNGSASVLATGGSAPYLYAWSNGAQTKDVNNLAPGFYSVSVYDEEQCFATETIFIEQSNSLSLTTSSTNAACGEENGTASISVYGGIPPFTYQWSNGGNTSSIDGLASEAYSVVVSDSQQCESAADVFVSNTDGITVTAIGINVSCNKGSNGSAMVTVEESSGNLSYLWSNGENTQTIEEISANTYTVTVTDNESGCSASSSIIISEPEDISIAINSINATCDQQNGTALASVSGGVTPYTYQWSTGDITQGISNLQEGSYTLTITDAKGCQKETSVNILGSAAILVSIQSTDVSCKGLNNGTATAQALNGLTFQYQWSNGHSTQTIENLEPGNYSVTVTESQSGCSENSIVTIEEPTEIILSTTSSETTCELNNGSATISAMGGTPPYAYLWANGTTSSTNYNLAAGSYQFEVSDSEGCQKSGFVLVESSNGISAVANGIDASCHDTNDGSVSVSVNGGSGNFVYQWSNGDNASSIYSLSPGNYEVSVTDIENGCTAYSSTTLSAPNSLNLSIVGINAGINSLGSADLTISGGTAPYSFLWSNGATTEDISNLSGGSYFVSVFDANDCFEETSITIEENLDCLDHPVNLNISLDNYPSETTWELKNGSGTVFANGGPYSIAGGSVAVELCLPQGCYEFTIYDSWGDGICCEYGEGEFQIIDNITGELLGSGGNFDLADIREFCIPTISNPCTYEVIDEEGFENGWGIWNDGGSDARRSIKDKPYANNGNYCVRLRDNTNSSVMTTDLLDLSTYEELTIEFSYYVRSFDNINEDFWLQISQNGGASYADVKTWNLGDEFQNNERKIDTVVIPGPFTSNAKLRFRADASGNSDWVYIDDVYLAGCNSAENKTQHLVRAEEKMESQVNNSEHENIYTIEKDLKPTDFQIFPNPVSTKLTIQLETTEFETVQFLISDFSGKTLKQFLKAENAHQVIIDLSDFPNGQYFVHKISRKNRISKKLVILR